MSNRDKLIGVLYIMTMLIGAPLFFGFAISALIWAGTGYFLKWWILYSIGLVITAVTVVPNIGNFYVINEAFRVSFWLDPVLGDKPTSGTGTEHLISRGPGFHFRGFWEIQDDCVTEHEKEVLVTTKDLKLETKGDSLNLELTGAQIVLQAPMDSAKTLRSIGRTMDVIRTEVQTQLLPSLKEAIAEEFIKWDSDYIMRNQKAIADAILSRFQGDTSLQTRYGLTAMKFSLGDVNYSDVINKARETAKASELHTDAADKIRTRLDIKSGKDALDMVFIGKNPDSLRVNRHDVTNLPEIIGTIAGLLRKPKE